MNQKTSPSPAPSKSTREGTATRESSDKPRGEASLERSFLGLQQAIGNRATRRIVNAGLLQIGTPDDRFERQTDRLGEPAAPQQTPGLIVEDDTAELGPDQMRKSAFLAEVRSTVCGAAEEVFARTDHTARGCIWIEAALRFYERQSAERLERDLAGYVPEAAGVASARDYVPFIAERARRSVAVWVETGEITGLPQGLPGRGLAGALAGSLFSGQGGIFFKTKAGGTNASADPRAIQARLGPGRPLAGAVRSRMESAFGQSFSGVRVHNDTTATRLSSRFDARAFTVGPHIAFGGGEYRPGTPAGDALLAHELAHVLQQRGGDAPRAEPGTAALEAEADRAATGTVLAHWGGSTRSQGALPAATRPHLRGGLQLQRCRRRPEVRPATEEDRRELVQAAIDDLRSRAEDIGIQVQRLALDPESEANQQAAREHLTTATSVYQAQRNLVPADDPLRGELRNAYLGVLQRLLQLVRVASEVLIGGGSDQEQRRAALIELFGELRETARNAFLGSEPAEGQPSAAEGATPSVESAPREATPLAGTENEVTAADRAAYAEFLAQWIEASPSTFALQPTQNLTEVLGNLRTTTESGLATIEGDPDAAALADQLRSAYRDAVRSVLLSRTQRQPGAIREPPTLQQLYEQHLDEILPFALPQGRADSGASELSAELTAPLPEDASRDERRRHQAIARARQRLRVVTESVDMPFHDLFSTEVATTNVPLPPNTTARPSSTIPESLHPGLQNVAGRLIGNNILPPNTTVMLALDLTPYGGSYDSYRFTRLDLGGLGTEVLIERQGSIGVEGLRSEEREQLQERFERVGFRREPGFRQGEFDQVLIGLSRIPEGRLTSLSGLRFEREAFDPEDPSAAADYDPIDHKVRVFDRAFSGGIARYGRGERPLTFAAYSVVHEIGHALDLSSLRTTAAATRTAEDALLEEFGTGGGRYEIPDPRDPRRARYDELMQGVRAAETAERAARSRSGARWTTGDPAEVTDALVRGATQPAFREAARRDGGRAGATIPTTQPDPESFWQEYFAESYALFQTSPELLQRMRPNVFAFMQEEFP